MLSPTNWKWSISKQQKANSIEVSPDKLKVSRLPIKSSNPAIMAEEPLTRNQNIFFIEILKLGDWVGIGIADNKFQLEGSLVLGSQIKGINSSYFYQKSTQKTTISMIKEKEFYDDAQPICVGDIIVVQIDFDNNQIFYYNNDLLQGYITCKNNILEETKLFPCVNLSKETELIFRNTIF
jgi:hypothetical protein